MSVPDGPPLVAFLQRGWRRPLPDCHLARLRVKNGNKPGDGTCVVLAPPTYVTNPGRKVGDGDKFFIEPGEVGDVPQVHHPGLAFSTLE